MYILLQFKKEVWKKGDFSDGVEEIWVGGLQMLTIKANPKTGTGRRDKMREPREYYEWVRDTEKD